MRVALYGEGPGDIGKSGLAWGLVPGDPLPEDRLGPAHDLVRRTLAWRSRQPEASIRFVMPLLDRGRQATGSALLPGPTLHRLLAWPPGPRRPELNVVLVDEDQERDRQHRLDDVALAALVPTVCAVARVEFESWLITDHEAVRSACGPGVGRPLTRIEQQRRRVAKDCLQGWTSGSADGGREIRRTIARILDLDILLRRSRSYRAFCTRLDRLHDPR